MSWGLHSFLGICLWGDLAVDSRKQPKGMMEPTWAKGDEAHAFLQLFLNQTTTGGPWLTPSRSFYFLSLPCPEQPPN